MTYPLRSGNHIDLLDSGAQFFPALIAALDAARHEIFFESYIYAEDHTAQKVTDALAAAARRGVAVRVIVDGFGARDLAEAYRASLVAAGVELLVYRPPLWWQPVRGLRRMHRKLAVADKALAFVGGINIVDDWNAPDEVPPRYDYSVRIKGPLRPHPAVLALLHHVPERARILSGDIKSVATDLPQLEQQFQRFGV